jgi:hypothetical protein
VPGRTDIDPLSITDGKISNQAKISHSKLATASEGQVLVAQSNGKFAAKTLSGDVTVAASGATTSNTVTTTDGTTVITGAQGPKGDKGATGDQGSSGPAGSDATVTTNAVDSAGAVMHTDITSDGFIKRSGLGNYAIDNSTYSASTHTHDHDALTNFVANEHLDWSANQQGSPYIHSDNIAFINTSAGQTDNGKPLVLDSRGRIDPSMIETFDLSYVDLDDLPNLSTLADGFTAHKYTKDITWETNSTGVVFSITNTASGDLSEAVCTITHNLGTKYIFVSAIEFSSTGGNPAGSDLNFVDNAQEQVDMNFGFIVKPTNDNAIELYGDGGVYKGSVFKISIIG